MRNHRLRERRLRLGASQYLVGCLAGFVPHNAQAATSAAERTDAGPNRWCGAERIRAVRAALVYLELQPRRLRAEARQEALDVAQTEAAIAATPMDEARIVTRLVDLLFDGRGEDFDALAARVPEQLAELAGEQISRRFAPSQQRRVPNEHPKPRHAQNSKPNGRA